jgi:hypothetical protein
LITVPTQMGRCDVKLGSGLEDPKRHERSLDFLAYVIEPRRLSPERIGLVCERQIQILEEREITIDVRSFGGRESLVILFTVVGMKAGP